MSGEPRMCAASTRTPSEAAIRPRVVIAEDYVLIQEAIRSLLEIDCDVLTAVEDGPAAIAAVAAYRPDVLLIDVSLPLANGFAVVEQLAQAHAGVKTIFVTAHQEPAYVERAFELGARGYVLKGFVQTELLPAIRQVMAGNLYRSASLPR